jgi:tetratricopeptide (TPR) repeat protein
VNTLLCQLPAQVGSPGGPVLNDRGELVGILSAKESAHMVAYAVTAEEIAAFLDVSLLNRAPRTLPGLFARLEAIPDRLAAAAATGFARDAEEHRTAGRIAEAKRDSDTAVSLGPGCALARLCRAKMLPAADALAELDVAVERGPFDRDVLFTRAGLATDTKDWRKARGDLERILHVNPSDADARQRLIGVLMDLGEDAKAAAAVADTLRADPKRLPAIAANLLSQADTLAKKFPDVPSIPADWLLKAMTAAKRTEFADVLKRAGAAKEETEKLAVLRDGLAKIK